MGQMGWHPPMLLPSMEQEEATDPRIARAKKIIEMLMQERMTPERQAPRVELPRKEVPEYGGPKPWVGKAQGILDSLIAVAQAHQAGKDRDAGYMPRPVTGGYGTERYLASREAGMAPIREADEFNLGQASLEAKMNASAELDQLNQDWSRGNVLLNSILPYILKDPAQPEAPEIPKELQFLRYLQGLEDPAQRETETGLLFPQDTPKPDKPAKTYQQLYDEAYWPALGEQAGELGLPSSFPGGDAALGPGSGIAEQVAQRKKQQERVDLAEKMYAQIIKSAEAAGVPIGFEQAMQQAYRQADQMLRLREYGMQPPGQPQGPPPAPPGLEGFGSFPSLGSAQWPQPAPPTAYGAGGQGVQGYQEPAPTDPIMQPSGDPAGLSGFGDPTGMTAMGALPPAPTRPEPGRSMELMPPNVPMPWKTVPPGQRLQAIRNFQLYKQSGQIPLKDLELQFYQQFGVYPDQTGTEEGM